MKDKQITAKEIKEWHIADILLIKSPKIKSELKELARRSFLLKNKKVPTLGLLEFDTATYLNKIMPKTFKFPSKSKEFYKLKLVDSGVKIISNYRQFFEIKNSKDKKITKNHLKYFIESLGVTRAILMRFILISELLKLGWEFEKNSKMKDEFIRIKRIIETTTYTPRYLEDNYENKKWKIGGLSFMIKMKKGLVEGTIARGVIIGGTPKKPIVKLENGKKLNCFFKDNLIEKITVGEKVFVDLSTKKKIIIIIDE